MALDFGAGCVGGAAGLVVGFPLDTVKVRIQTQDPTKGKLKYTSTFQCLRSIIKEEGARTMYRGVNSPLAGVAAINAICFGVYGNVNRRLTNPESLRSVTIAGMASGAVQALVCGPLELVKIQQQTRSDGKSATETLRSIVDKSGFKGLTRGLGITAMREVPAFGIYFSSYEYMVRLKKDSAAWVFTVGGISGILSWIFTYPIDMVKTRLQADTIGAGQQYKGILNCLKQSVASEGYSCLFRGVGSTVIRAFPTNAATMGVVTWIMKTFSEEQEVDAYETIKRLRMAEGLHVNLPPVVEKYFEISSHTSKQTPYFYQNNVVTLATDGPNIVFIGKPDIALSMTKLYVEHMHWSMPSSYQIDANATTVGTMRSDVSLSTIIRVVERILKKKQEADKDSVEDLLWSYKNAFMNKTSDFMMDSSSGSPLSVIAKEEIIIEDSKNIPLKPSLLQRLPSRNSQLTTADFLQPTSLVTSNHENKIYGFYYLV